MKWQVQAWIDGVDYTANGNGGYIFRFEAPNLSAARKKATAQLAIWNIRLHGQPHRYHRKESGADWQIPAEWRNTLLRETRPAYVDIVPLAGAS